jgi:hypothetical protein
LDKTRRAVLEVHEDLHREIRKLALLNDLRIYELTSAILKEFLGNQEQIKTLVRKLKI